MRLKIGDDFLDGDNSVIAQTFAVNEIGDIQTQQGGFSNDFTIPLTAKNKSILGFPDNINSASRNPYEKVDATLYDNGVPIAEGYLRYTVASDTELEASFFSDNVNWFNLLKGKKLSDLDLSEWDHVWNPTAVASSFSNTEGYIYPFICYGAFQPEASSTTTVLVDDENWLPSIFMHTLIKRIFFEVGYKIEGSVVDSNIFNKTILPFSNSRFHHSPAWISDNTYTDTVNAPHTITVATTNIPWTTAGGGVITWANESCLIKCELTLQLSGADAISVRARSGALISEWQVTPTPTGTEEYTFIFTLDTVGRKLEIQDTVYAAGGSDQLRFEIKIASGTGTISATSTLTVTPLPDYIQVSTVSLSDVVPKNMKQTDLLKYAVFSFGAILQTNPLSKTITWNYFRNIKGNLPNAIDWSDKLDMSKTREIDFTELLSKYGQESFLDYKSGQNDDELTEYEQTTGKTLGEGIININNEHLPGIKTYYTSPFSPTVNVLNPFTSTGTSSWLTVQGEVIIPFIPFWKRSRTSGGVVTRTPQSVGFRILILEDDLVSISDLTGNKKTSVGGTSPAATTVPYSWFEKQTIGIASVDNNIETLAYDSSEITNVTGEPLIERFLTDQEAILNSMKYLSASLWLTEADIANLDFTIPIYLDRYKSYFYISKIEDFQGRERTTECELVKIS